MDDEEQSRSGQNWRGSSNRFQNGHQRNIHRGNNRSLSNNDGNRSRIFLVEQNQRGGKRGRSNSRGHPSRGPQPQRKLFITRHSEADTPTDDSDDNNQNNGGARRRDGPRAHPRRGPQPQRKLFITRHSEADTPTDDNDDNNQNNGGARRRDGPRAHPRREQQRRSENQPESAENNKTTNNMHSQNNRGSNGNKNRNSRPLGFRDLDEIAQAEIKDTMIKINERKESLLNVLQLTYDEKNWDSYVLLLKIISKICASSFDELKLKLLLDICNSKFIANLRNYLVDLPYVGAENQRRNQYYWNNQYEFWENFVSFCESILNLSPSTALSKCRSLIEGSSKLCIDELKDRHGFNLLDRQLSKLEEMRERLTSHEKEKDTQVSRPKQGVQSKVEEGEPPDDFRQLSVLPTHEDLLVHEPFVRRNVVQGGYRDVDHYLDVQFRLLREDCFGPLREGIRQYIEKPNDKKYDNIKVYRNVKFIDSYINNGKVGSKVQLDQHTMKRFRKVNWAHSKRFIYGSLLLFTKDNCRTFITATILDRDLKLITQGKIPVSLVDTVGDDLYNGDSYTMIESEVYFEPYYHVLKALQEPKFPRHLAMQKYIVKVDPIPKPPAYMSPDAVFAVETQPSVKTKFRVLQDETWPTNEDLKLNDSQYEAYKLALTHEFAVIQGPPGTGKTFLGVKVAKTLLENLTPEQGACLMLVICYTNHALDQFLEAIQPVAQSMVRIGGQSRSEEMKKINLNDLRKKVAINTETKRMFYEQKNTMKCIINELQRAQGNIDSLNNGIISLDDLKRYAPECGLVETFYNKRGVNVGKDPLLYWLFEERTQVNFQDALDEYTQNGNEAAYEENADEDTFKRTGMIFDDFTTDDGGVLDNDEPIRNSFSVKEVTDKLKKLIKTYESVSDVNKQNQRHLQQEIVNLYSLVNHFYEMSMNRTREPQILLDHNAHRVNFSRITMADRWSLYYKWADKVLARFKLKIGPLQKDLESANKAYEEVRMLMDLQILKGVKVIGMTTSGAARLRKLLEMLSPPIVIVEEAAEVLEQHIVTSLTKDCEHLILIGDHQQLRPSAAYMKLARKYHLEVSLFERMITNGMHSRRLSVQHRMRPEIAALVGTHIYSYLANHPSVERFPNVRGMVRNMYFLSHNYMEQEVADSSSRSNHKEAELALRLANYLMQQGCYADSDVTILAAYSGQMFYMRKQREKYSYLKHVKITVLDNYQGEESRIIILSLVRNNNNDKIGFLQTENRVCVALSRAREGFYMLGNMNILKRNASIWQKVAGTLQENAALGTALQLKCENHKDQITDVSTPEDFDKAPEGGCLLKCGYDQLPCGHQCEMFCHSYDRTHEKYKCYKDCERFCEKGHQCPYKCWEDCGDCKVRVEKELPCGHKMMVFCHLDPAHPTVKCTSIVTVTLQACKHETQKFCHADVNLVKCPVPCTARVESCGHQCELKCHVTNDPDHEKYYCHKPCAKAKKGCTANLEGDRGVHQCQKMCFESCDECTVKVEKSRKSCKHKKTVACNEDVDATECRQKCARVIPGCGHHCKNKCFEPCGNCNQMVTKTILECHHAVSLKCKEEATPDRCTQPCERILSCGHQCKGRCNKPCDPQSCTEKVAVDVLAPCGHRVKQLPCSVFRVHYGGRDSAEWRSTLLRHCSAPCGRDLRCGHACSGTCAACRRARLHAPCRAPCGRALICGHQCEEPCSQECPPCKKDCEVKCEHSRCSKLCGQPCVPCQEPCTRKCPHGACSRRCGETCSRDACDEACPLPLKCGHRCRGLCGEPCPPACKECRPEEFPTGLMGEDIEDDERLIKLQDCPHMMEVDTMDTLMKTDQTEITIRSCPMCRKPIVNTQRYKDIVNNMFKNYINPIKQKLFGDNKEINDRKEQLLVKILELTEKNQFMIQEIPPLNRAVDNIRKIVSTQKKVSLSKVLMQSQYLEILDILTERYQKYKDAKTIALKEELLDVMKTICEVLVENVHKISQQLQTDIASEMKRMGSIVQLAQILSHDSYKCSKTVTKVVESENLARSVVFAEAVFDENAAVIALKQLQESVSLFGIVSKEERDLIVRAIGAKAGSWYMCPNGHPYGIDQCGGAMEESRCADCGAPIGGSNHRLLSTNRHAGAGEIDGSRHAAWSNAYNNMANFVLD